MTGDVYPIRRVRSDGVVDDLGVYVASTRRLELVRPGFPLSGPGVHDVDGDIPWVFEDISPQGYLARRFVRWFPELPGGPPNVERRRRAPRDHGRGA